MKVLRETGLPYSPRGALLDEPQGKEESCTTSSILHVETHLEPETMMQFSSSNKIKVQSLYNDIIASQENSGVGTGLAEVDLRQVASYT